MSRSAEMVLCECAPFMALFVDRREPFGIRGITHVHCFWARPELNRCVAESQGVSPPTLTHAVHQPRKSSADTARTQTKVQSLEKCGSVSPCTASATEPP